MTTSITSPDQVRGHVPEIALSIERTERGNYRAHLFEPVRLPGSLTPVWREFETVTEKKLPDFMWQLAKRIMPK